MYLNDLQMLLDILQHIIETTALALDSASGSDLSAEALSMYVKHAHYVKTTAGQSSLSRIWSRSRGFEKGHIVSSSI